MAASEVDICNLALAHLGQAPNVSSIDPPEGSAEAQHCATFYPIARDAMLEMHAWRFATRRVALALLSEPPPTGWLYAYALPSCIKPLAVLPPGGVDTDVQDFTTEVRADDAQVIYANVEKAVLVFTAKITDPTRFSALFVNALSWLLASYLAGPIRKDPKIKAAIYEMFQVENAKATASDGDTRRADPYTSHLPDAIRARA